LTVCAASQVEISLVSSWRKDYESSKFESVGMIGAVFPPWFGRWIMFLIGPTLCALYLANQPKSWPMVFVIAALIVLWLLALLPLVQRSVLLQLVVNAEWMYMTAVLGTFFGLHVFQTVDSGFIMHWMSRLRSPDSNVSTDLTFLTTASILWHTGFFISGWSAVCADAVAAPHRLWKVCNASVMMLVNLLITFAFLAKSNDGLELSPRVCFWRLCDSAVILSSQLAIIRLIFIVKYAVNLWRSPGALIILRAPIHHQIRPILNPPSPH
jgi:hypothetical protein